MLLHCAGVHDRLSVSSVSVGRAYRLAMVSIGYVYSVWLIRSPTWVKVGQPPISWFVVALIHVLPA